MGHAVEINALFFALKGGSLANSAIAAHYARHCPGLG
jgi:hypothetical protein